MADTDAHEAIHQQILYYDDRAPEFDSRLIFPDDPLEAQDREVRMALDAFAPEGTVLELACGTGNWTDLLLLHATEVTAVDASARMLELARRKVGHSRVRYVKSDVFNYQPDASYDAVVFMYWLSHVPPMLFDDFWSRVRACLKPSGRVFFADESHHEYRDEEFIQTEPIPLVRRELESGKSYSVVKVFWEPSDLQRRLEDLGWIGSVHSTGALYWGSGAFSSLQQSGGTSMSMASP